MTDDKVLPGVEEDDYNGQCNGCANGTEVLCPPVNFAMVDVGVYRSGYPSVENLPFLKKLRLKSIVYLCPEAYPAVNDTFVKQEGIRLYQLGIEGNKETETDEVCRDILADIIKRALRVVLDPMNHPLLIHCNKGKHRTGYLVGCLRKLQGWCMAAVEDEYGKHAGSKVRALEVEFMRQFDGHEFGTVEMGFSAMLAN